jgi:preprotein translocase subunit YajC
LPDTGNSIISSVLWFGVFFVVMYFLMIRPQQKEQKARAEMLKNLKPGDKVVSNGGIIGVITRVDDMNVKMRIAERVEIDLLKTGVGRVIND